MPGHAVQPVPGIVRRLSNSASQIFRWSCGPVKAATAPFWAKVVGLLVLWLWMASMALAMGSGAAHQTQPPAGHATSLGQAMDDDGVLVMRGRKLATLRVVAPS